MHKAYDRVEWLFLKQIMLKLWFDPRWIELIMACVSSVTYRVRFNGSETEEFVPSRGLRQGDPLSPYLFLLVAEGLSAMLKGAEERGELEGVSVCRAAPQVSHLLFADDSLLLMIPFSTGWNTYRYQSSLRPFPVQPSSPVRSPFPILSRSPSSLSTNDSFKRIKHKILNPPIHNTHRSHKLFK